MSMFYHQHIGFPTCQTLIHYNNVAAVTIENIGFPTCQTLTHYNNVTAVTIDTLILTLEKT